MPTYEVWQDDNDASTIVVQLDAADDPADHTSLGTFDHDEETDELDAVPSNHTLFHHVQDVLYQNGIENMQAVNITVPVTDVAFDTAPPTQDADTTLRLEWTITPEWAPNKGVTFESDDETKATVDENGIVTFVATGTATVTITADDGGATDTLLITVN